jgi:hypothetical protein
MSSETGHRTFCPKGKAKGLGLFTLVGWLGWQFATQNKTKQHKQ